MRVSWTCLTLVNLWHVSVGSLQVVEIEVCFFAVVAGGAGSDKDVDSRARVLGSPQHIKSV